MTKKNNQENTCIKWFWIRHAPVLARENTFTGSSDVPADLDAVRTEIENLATALPQCPDLWISSTLKRAKQTVQALREARQTQRGASEQGVDAQDLYEHDFAEQNFGDWEGERYDEARHRALWESPATHRPPNGESFADLARRVACAVERIENTHRRISESREESITVVAIAHAGTIRAALAQALTLPPQRALSFAIEPLSLTRIDRYRHCRQDEQKAGKDVAVRCVNVRAS